MSLKHQWLYLNLLSTIVDVQVKRTIRVYPHPEFSLAMQDQVPDVLSLARPAYGVVRRAIVLVGYQAPIPAQNGVRCRDAGEFRERFAAEGVTFLGKSSTLGVGEHQACVTELLAQHAIFFAQVLDGEELSTVDSAAHGKQDEVEGSCGHDGVP